MKPLTAEELDLWRRRCCPRDENQGRGPDCPDHPRSAEQDNLVWVWCDRIMLVLLAALVGLAVFGGFK